MELPVGGRHHRERQGQPEDSQDPGAVAHGPGDIEQRGRDGHAAPQIAAEAAGQRGLDLLAVGMILHLGQARGEDVGIAEHAPTEGDQRHPRPGGLGRAQDERPHVLGRRRLREQAARLVMKEPAGGGQPGLQRLDGEGFQGAVEVEAGGQRRQAHEADQRQRQLDGDPLADEVEEGAQHQSVSQR